MTLVRNAKIRLQLLAIVGSSLAAPAILSAAAITKMTRIGAVTESIAGVFRGLNALTEGRTAVQVPVRSDDEVAQAPEVFRARGIKAIERGSISDV